MIKKILILLPIIWLNLVYGVKLNSITPAYINSDFASKIEDHQLIANVTLESNERKSIMLFIGDIDLDYDRELPDENYIYCINQENKLVIDWSRQENYVYSCCSLNSEDNYYQKIIEEEYFEDEAKERE